MAKGDRITKRRRMDSCDEGEINSSIPEELVYTILLYLPANVIFDVMRCVCRMWYTIIRNPSFISSHLKSSTSGLIIRRQPGYLAKMNKFELTVQSLKFRFRGTVLASCDGLVLFIDKRIMSSLWVANPITKQQLKLPQSTSFCAGICGFGYAVSSRKYKVVSKQSVYFYILTLGVDKAWRRVYIDKCYLTTVKWFALSVGGFVYWAYNKGPFVLSLDIETEISKEIRLPQGCENMSMKLLAMGSSLSIILSKAIDLWEVWLLMDKKSGEWKKLPDVNFQGQAYNCPEGYPTPVGWLQRGEILVFSKPFPSDKLLVYNVKTGIIDSCFDLDSGRFGYQKIYGPHVNSLVRLP